MNTYLKQAFNELFAEDGLTVVGRGLGMPALFCKFAQYYSSTKTERKIVFCLNCTGSEDALKDYYTASSSNNLELPQIINNEVTSDERVERYAQGGCFIITSRILIVDLLDNKVDAKSVSGLLIYNAHRISETSIESFILKVFRERNRFGFVKAFSEEPEALQSGFGKVERLLKVLFVKKLYLWPRFRLEVVQALSQNKEPEVVELVTDLTPTMKIIQSAILVAMNSCIQELKKAAPNLETSQMTLENGLFHAFDFSIKSQLESEWHRTAPRTKQLVADVGVLRKLLDYLVRYDAFSFYYLLMKLQLASSEQTSPSLWLMSEAANQIFKKAKERVYRIAPLTASKASSAQRKKTTPIESPAEVFLKEATDRYGLTSTLEASAECPPKWKLAVDVLKEIKEDFQQNKTASASSSSPAAPPLALSDTAGRVLFIVKDSLAMTQLRDVLVNGVDSVTDQRYRWFVSQQAAEIRNRVYKQYQQQSSRGNNNRWAGNKRPADAASGGASKQMRTDSSNINSGSGSSNNLAAASADNRNIFLYPKDSDLLGVPSTEEESKQQASTSAPASSAGVGLELGLPPQLFASLPMESKLVLVQERYLRLLSPQAPSTTELKDSSSNPSSARDQQSAALFSQDSCASADSCSSQDPQKRRKASVLDPALHVMLMTHAEARENLSAMQDCSPAYVVLYDADITLIRAVETYQSMLPATASPVKVYFILYEGSAEEHKYVGALSKEKKAFESLILTKEHMVISLPDHPLDVLQEAQADKLLLSVDTRTVHRGSSNSSNNKGPRGIVVDVREFRSTLPSMLYASGRFSVVPRTITVGDYVLSPEICVERKGISDLFQSFASGRLYNQAESMGRHYKHPCLLIEFSPDKVFALTTPNEMSTDILQHAITSRIALLALSFPNLRILWSRSAASTVEIFRSLVSNHAEVDVLKAVSAGSVNAIDGPSGGSAHSGNGGGEEGEEDGGNAPAGYYDEAARPNTNSSSSKPTAVVSSKNNNEVPEDSARASAREILLSLPGISVHNFRDIMNNVNNLAELSTMTEQQLMPLIGPVNAKKLVTFFTQSA